MRTSILICDNFLPNYVFRKKYDRYSLLLVDLSRFPAIIFQESLNLARMNNSKSILIEQVEDSEGFISFLGKPNNITWKIPSFSKKIDTSCSLAEVLRLTDFGEEVGMNPFHYYSAADCELTIGDEDGTWAIYFFPPLDLMLCGMSEKIFFLFKKTFLSNSILKEYISKDPKDLQAQDILNSDKEVEQFRTNYPLSF